MRLGPRSRSRLLTPLTRFLLLIFEQVNGRLGRLRLAENDARRPPEQGSSIAGRRTGMRLLPPGQHRQHRRLGDGRSTAGAATALMRSRRRRAPDHPRRPGSCATEQRLHPCYTMRWCPVPPNLAPAGRRLQESPLHGEPPCLRAGHTRAHAETLTCIPERNRQSNQVGTQVFADREGPP